ncbi:hypothetical protein LSAT2_026427, partial [Lamellibrachia satsuma]
RCQCPPGYSVTSRNTKCARDGARTGLQEGATCDEINQISYCGFGLVCLKLKHATFSKCVTDEDDAKISKINVVISRSSAHRQELSYYTSTFGLGLILLTKLMWR